MALGAIAGLALNFLGSDSGKKVTENVVGNVIDNVFDFFGGKDEPDVTDDNREGVVNLLSSLSPSILEQLLEQQKVEANGDDTAGILANLDEDSLEGLLQLLMSGGNGLDILS